MSRDLENEFGRDEDRLKGRSRRRDVGAGAGADSDTASVRRPRTGEPRAGLGGEPKAGLGGEPKAGLGREPKAGLSRQPRAGLGGEPKAGLSREPKAGLGRESKAGLGAEPGTGRRPEMGASRGRGEAGNGTAGRGTAVNGSAGSRGVAGGTGGTAGRTGAASGSGVAGSRAGAANGSGVVGSRAGAVNGSGSVGSRAGAVNGNDVAGSRAGAANGVGAPRQPKPEGYGAGTSPAGAAGTRGVRNSAVGNGAAGTGAGVGAAGSRTGAGTGAGASRARVGTGTGIGTGTAASAAGSRIGTGTAASAAGSRAAGRQGSRIYTPEVSFGDDGKTTARGAGARSGGRSAVLESAAADPEVVRSKNTRKMIIIMIVLELFIILPGIWVIRNFISKYNMIQRDTSFNIEKETNPNLDIGLIEKMDGYWTVALFGVDSRDNSLGKYNNADVIIIANVNQDNGEIKLVSIFRDTYLNLDDDGTYNKINQAYFKGGPEQAIKALNKNLDIQIDDYATFNWKAVADSINILGGVDVELSKAEFYYINAYITETVKATNVASQHLKSAGQNHLDGVQAVAYARLRKMDTDFARTERQREVIQQAFSKLKKANFSVINNVMEVVFQQILTSVDYNDIIPLAKNMTKYTIVDTKGFPMARSDANMGKKGDCVIPQTLESNVILLHEFLFDEQDYEPSEMVKKISAKISADSGLYNSGKPIDRVGTDGGYIPKPTQAPATAAETSAEEPDDDESDVSTSEIDESIIDGEYEWELETDEFGNVIDPPEDEFMGQYPGGRPSGGVRPGESSSGLPYPGYTTSPADDSNGDYIYPGSSTSGSDEMTGPGVSATYPGSTKGTTPAYPGSNKGTTSAYPGSNKGTAPAYPGSTNGTTSAYPGSTKGSTAPYPGSTTEEYVPEGPGSVIIGPGN